MPKMLFTASTKAQIELSICFTYASLSLPDQYGVVAERPGSDFKNTASVAGGIQ